MKLTKTQTKNTTNTKLALATLAMLAAGGMALATAPLMRSGAAVPLSVPDLEAVSITQVNETFPEGAGYRTTAVYRNNGNKTIGPFRVTIYGEKTVGQELYQLSTAFIDKIKSLEQKTMTDYAVLPIETSAFMVKVDSGDQVAETNKNNNIKWYSRPARENNDLGIRNFVLTPLAGNQGEVSFDVVNYSGLNLNKTVDVTLQRFDNETHRLLGLLSVRLSELKAGRQTTFKHIISTDNATVGRPITLLLNVDRDNILNDAVRNNNEIRKSFMP